MASDSEQTESSVSQKTIEDNDVDALLPAVCRTCLAAENDVDVELYKINQIYLEEEALTTQVQSFEDVLCLFIDDEMEKLNDRIPRSICMACVEKARSAFQFIEMCRQTDATLKRCLLEDKSVTLDQSGNSGVTSENNQETVSECVTETKHIETEYLDEADVAQKSSKRQSEKKDESTEEYEIVLFEDKSDGRNKPYKADLDKRHMCDICHKTFTQPQTMNRHKKIHSRDSQPGKSCNFCDRVFLRSDDLRRHIRTHTNERPYACDQCPRAYKQSFELKEHKESAHPIAGVRKMLACTICDKKLTTRNGLYVHMKAHRGEKNHSCSYCSKRFVTSGELTSHLRHIHTDRVNVEIIACDQKGCTKKFVTKAAWKHHLAKKHKVHH